MTKTYNTANSKQQIDLLRGVAYNSGGRYKSTENNKMSKSYAAWKNMLDRCYCTKCQLRQPTYINCSVFDEWLDFQAFAEWFCGHEYSGAGYCLDKDLLFAGNKVYSPHTCCFVPQELNKLLSDRKAARGDLPQGVSYFKRDSNYVAGISINAKRKNLGYFDCPNEAHQVYKKAKEAYVKEKALEWKDRIADNVFQALMNWQLTD